MPKWLISRLLQMESSMIPHNNDLALVITNLILKKIRVFGQKANELPLSINSGLGQVVTIMILFSKEGSYNF